MTTVGLDPATGAYVHASVDREGTIVIHESGFIQTLTEFMSSAKEGTYVTTTEPNLAELEAAREVELQKLDKAKTKAMRHSDRIKELDAQIEEAQLPREPRSASAVVRVEFKIDRFGGVRLAEPLAWKLGDGNWMSQGRRSPMSWVDLIRHFRSRSVDGKVVAHELIKWRIL